MRFTLVAVGIVAYNVDMLSLLVVPNNSHLVISHFKGKMVQTVA